MPFKKIYSQLPQSPTIRDAYNFFISHILDDPEHRKPAFDAYCEHFFMKKLKPVQTVHASSLPDPVFFNAISTPTDIVFDGYLFRFKSVIDSLVLFYPFFLYGIFLTFLLIFFAGYERQVRRTFGIFVKNKLPVYFFFYGFGISRESFPFQCYSLMQYFNVLRLNILSLRVYIYHRYFIIFLIIILYYHFFLTPYLLFQFFNFLSWLPISSSNQSLSVLCSFYWYFLFGSHSSLTIPSFIAGSYGFFNHFYINDFLIFIILIFLGVTSILLYVMEKIVTLDVICNYEFSILLGYNILSQCLLLCCCNFFTLLVLVEIFSYTMYILITLRKQISWKLISENATKLYLNNPLATEAGMKYFLYGAINSFVFIIALILLLIPNYDLTYMNFSYIFYLSSFTEATYNNMIPFSLTISFLVLIFFLFKIAAFPFHWWLPDVFAAASYLVISYIGLPVKLVFIVVFLFIFYGVFENIVEWGFLTVLVSLVGMLWGAIGMLQQKQLKRFFAYSTINHMSYIIYGFALPAYFSQIQRDGFNIVDLFLRNFQTVFDPKLYVAYPTNVIEWSTETYNTLMSEAITASIVYLIGYILMMLMVFTFLIVVQDTEKPVGYLGQVVHLSAYSRKIFRIIFFLLLMSLIGVPPLLGFWGKYYLFFLAIKVSLIPAVSYFSYLVVISPLIIVLSSVVSAYGYLTLVKNMYYTEVSSKYNKIESN